MKRIQLIMLMSAFLFVISCKKDKDQPPSNNNNPLVADFVMATTSGIATAYLGLTNTSTGATSYLWTLNFENSAYDPSTPYSATTKDAGFYVQWPSNPGAANLPELKVNVKLTVSNGTDTRYVSKSFTLKNPGPLGPLVADFWMNTTSGIAPLALTLTNSSTGATSYNWTLNFENSAYDPFTPYSATTKDAGFNVQWPSNSGAANLPELKVNVKLAVSNGTDTRYANKSFTLKNPQDCARNATAKTTVTITSSNPYRFYVNGVLQGTISGNSSKSFVHPAGVNNSLKVEQVSGYVAYPTVATDVQTQNACSEWSWKPVL
ncbi:MAG: hypothetical protein LC115_02405 [Bacteroidia bacterium]|nr:hypothetical protein [Bacteroidia bacterium]